MEWCSSCVVLLWNAPALNSLDLAGVKSSKPYNDVSGVSKGGGGMGAKAPFLPSRQSAAPTDKQDVLATYHTYI